MSALQFYSMPKSQEPCMFNPCNGRCRWKPMILGQLIEDAPLCGKHRQAWQDMWIAAREPERASERALGQAA